MEEKTLASLQQLYDRGRYDEVFEMASLLASESKDSPVLYKIWTLCAKAYLRSIDVLTKETEETFTKAAFLAFTTARTVEEETWVEGELRNTVADWAPKTMQKTLKTVLRSPTNENRRLYMFNFSPILYQVYNAYCMVGLCVEPMSPVGSGNCSRIGQLEEAEQELVRQEVWGVSEFPEVDQVLLHNMMLEAAAQLEEDVQQKLEANAHGSIDYVTRAMNPITDELLLIGTMYAQNRPVDSVVETNPELAKSCYLAELNYLRYMLDALYYPNGKPVSVILSQDVRDNYVKEWRNVKYLLQKIDPRADAGPEPYAPVTQKYQSSSGGCYVATAVYGSYDCPQVWTLRRFRDNTLARSWYGRMFIRAYYAVSPTLVRWFGDTGWFRSLWRGRLDRLVEKLKEQGVESTPYQDKNW